MWKQMRFAVTLLLLGVMVLLPAAGVADERVEIDYSREKLLWIFRNLEEQQRAKEREKARERLEVERWGTTFRYMPLLAPLPLAGPVSGSASIFPEVNPFALLGVDFPLVSDAGLPSASPLTREEKRYRKEMLSWVRRTNGSENAARP